MHRHGQFLDLNGRMGYKIHIGERFQVQVNYQDIRMLEKSSQKKLRFKQKSEKSCTQCEYDSCMYGAVERIMRQRTIEECTAPWIRNASDICSNPDDVEAAFWVAWNRITNQKLDCAVPCHSLIINIGAKNVESLSKKKQFGEFYFYFSPRIPLSEELYFYTFLSLMAEIGGYVGLLLGVSLFHFAGWLTSVLAKQINRYEQNLLSKNESLDADSEDNNRAERSNKVPF